MRIKAGIEIKGQYKFLVLPCFAGAFTLECGYSWKISVVTDRKAWSPGARQDTGT